MSLLVAVPFGCASATVYGASIVVQHRVAQQSADTHGEANAAGLMQLAKHPVFLLAMAGDSVGFLLQIVALSAGPVVVIQPLVVLMLPVSLVVSAMTGGPRPRVGDYLGVLSVVLGLGTFLALVGSPSGEHIPKPRYLVITILAVLIVGGLLALLASACTRIVKGAGYGAVAGFYFGTLAVMVDAASDRFSERGVHGLLESARGLVPLLGILVLGAGGILLTQLSFQVGALSATLPANIAADPFVGVLLGAVLLHEHIPLTGIHLVAYVACLAAVVAGAIRLADPDHAGSAGAAGAAT